MNVLRVIMSAGSGLLITTIIGSFVCINSWPIPPHACIELTVEVAGVLEKAGFTYYAVGTAFFGGLVYLITTKGRIN